MADDDQLDGQQADPWRKFPVDPKKGPWDKFRVDRRKGTRVLGDTDWEDLDKKK